VWDVGGVWGGAMVCFSAFWTYFLSVSSRENVEFSAWNGDLVDVEDALLRSSEYSVRVTGLVRFLLHCNASNLVHKIVKHDKIRETICIRISYSKFWGTCPPVIYAHDPVEFRCESFNHCGDMVILIINMTTVLHIGF